MSPLDQPNPTSEWQPLEDEKLKAKKSKWILISVVIVVLGVAGFLYYYFFIKQQKPTSTVNSSDQTADWPQYENKIYGYSIKYKKDWQVDDSNDADVKFLSRQTGDPTLAIPQKTYFEIKSSASSSSSYNDWFTELSLKGSKSEDFLIGGKDGKSLTLTSKKQVFLIADSIRYQIIQNDLSDSEFLQAAKSFALIARKTSTPSKTTPTDVVLGQTYTNETYHYLIKYPSDWIVNSGSSTSPILDEEDFRNMDTDVTLFYVKVTTRSLTDEISAYKASLNGESITKESNVTVSQISGTKIVSSKDSLENTATFLVKNNRTYVLWGKSADSLYKLYYDQMITSMEFTT